MKLQDFPHLGPAEQKLIAWLQAGERSICVISDGVPATEIPDVTICAELIRYLALGGCDACRPPATGVRLKGAWITGDWTLSDNAKGLNFEGATLPADLWLLSCCIPNPLNLRSARTKNLRLSRSVLGGGIKGSGLQAEGGIDLAQALITGEVRLIGATISGDLTCDDTIIHGIDADGVTKGLTANRIKIGGAFKLRKGARISGRLSLDGAAMHELSDESQCWPRHIVLNLCRYEAFGGQNCPTDAKRRLDWLSRTPRPAGGFQPEAYEHCAKVLREMGHAADAREILIEKEHLQRKARRTRLNLEGQAPFACLIGLADCFLNLTIRYGHQPLWAFAWLFALWFYGTLIFDTAALKGEIKPNLPQMQVHSAWVACAEGGALRGETPTQVDCFINQPEGRSYPAFNPIIYSADTLFPVVSLEMQSYWIPDDREPFGKYARWYLWFHIAMGWALTLLAVAGFSGLIKTDSK